MGGQFKGLERTDDNLPVTVSTYESKMMVPPGLCLKGSLVLMALLASGLTLQGEDVYDSANGWGCNIPETWVAADVAPEMGSYTFSDSRGHAFFQVLLMKKPAEATAHELLVRVAGNLKAAIPQDYKSDPAQGAPSSYGASDFTVNGRPASLADLCWNMGSYPMRGYLTALDGKDFDVVLMAVALETEWSGYHDFLLSVMDSFYMDAEAALLPGPLTQFVADDQWAGGHIGQPEKAVDASQAMIEREAWVLSQYAKADPDAQVKAWRRFYQAVYRDSFLRLEELAAALRQAFSNNKTDKKDIPVKLLHYVQAFKYEELDTASDLRAPYDAAMKRLGDCDSRSLVYMILLEHLGYKSVLMISSVHGHSVVGVDLEGPGARFPFAGKDWLVAETTTTVALGEINKTMADPKDWIGMDLHTEP